MKKLLASILCLCLIFTSAVVAVSTSVSADGYQLVWSDEFDGNGVNPYNWTLDQGVRNGERQTSAFQRQLGMTERRFLRFARKDKQSKVKVSHTNQN